MGVTSAIAILGLNEPPRSMWSRFAALAERILLSFSPSYRRVPIDLWGAGLALVLVTGLLYNGHTNKNSKAALALSPLIVMFLYATCMPLMTYVLVRLGRGLISLPEAVTIVGYGLYGHLLTFQASMAFNNEESNTVFFCCMVVIGGLSALHVAIALLVMIPQPAVRLIVCSVTPTLQLLSLVFLHFAYMHTTFQYAHRL